MARSSLFRLHRPIAERDLARVRLLSLCSAQPEADLVLSTPVALHDIRDVNMFVRNALDKAPVTLGTQEFEELVAEGLAILYELAKEYEPHRAGYERAGSFAGYASVFLSHRLTDAWHRSHAEHRYITVTEDDGTQRRAWEYLKRTVSFDAQRETFTRSDMAPVSDDREGRYRDPATWVPVPAAELAA